MKVNLLLFISIVLDAYAWTAGLRFVAFSFGRNDTDVSGRQIDSARAHDIDLRLIDTSDHVAMVTDIAAMRDYLQLMQSNNDPIVIFVEGGSLFLNSSDEIIMRFKGMNASVVIAADTTCEPDSTLTELFPLVAINQKRFVAAEGIIGYRSVLLDLLNVPEIRMIDDKQYYLAKLFTSPDLRERFSIKLDSKSEIFQNLWQSYDDVTVEHSIEGVGHLHNTRTHVLPAVVQPGYMQVELDSLSNYLGKSWDPVKGCQHCSLKKIDLGSETGGSTNYPTVTLAVFIHQPTPFLNEFFQRLSELSYPKSRVSLVISSLVPSHDNIARGYLDTHKDQYITTQLIDSSHNSSSLDRRNLAMGQAKNISQYVMVLDSIVQLTMKDTIETLMSYNKTVVAPLVSRRGQLWSNFWGALGDDGYYRRSRDYLDIVNGEKRGLWLAPQISNAYLIKTGLFDTLTLPLAPLQLYQGYEVDMVFSGHMRLVAMSMWVVNEDKYGYLVNADSMNTTHMHNDLWEIFTNPEDWEEKYIHPEYHEVAQPTFRMKNFTQPCTDVFWWPLLSETFCKELIEEMEFFGQWSDGSNKDTRLEGGYENVPTRDIHMRQVDWEEHWMHVLKKYVYPIQLKLYEGYSDEPRARMNFVVRYKPTEQDRLRPHHDASSYTLNIALNKPGKDYEGGGAKFNRYDCAVIKSRVGWVLMSPGRVTHLHEGLPTTKGTRYIFVTFINP